MEKITLINKDGTEANYDVVLAYEDPNTEKGYLVYTEDKENGHLYIASYDPNNEDDLDLRDVETEEEKNMILDLLKNFK